MLQSLPALVKFMCLLRDYRYQTAKTWVCCFSIQNRFLPYRAAQWQVHSGFHQAAWAAGSRFQKGVPFGEQSCFHNQSRYLKIRKLTNLSRPYKHNEAMFYNAAPRQPRPPSISASFSSRGRDFRCRWSQSEKGMDTAGRFQGSGFCWLCSRWAEGFSKLKRQIKQSFQKIRLLLPQ